MSEVTRILSAIEQGDPQAAAQLLPLVYDELRRLAAQKLAQEKPGQTLDATALVHEAYLRLVGDQAFTNHRHFFAAAAEAMRRILVERARRKGRLRHGGGRRQVKLPDDLAAEDEADAEILAVDEALDQFARHNPEATELVRLHFFGGLTIEQAADLLGVSPRTAYRHWQYARAWLYRRLSGARGEKVGSPEPPTAHGRVAHPEEQP
jgi:RNA polymerase sigma factor (TIGR02999 family)